MSQYVAVARADEVPPGTGRQLDVGGRAVALFNIDGTFYAMDGSCLHRGGPVGEGDVEGTVVTCPWHGSQYDVTTGEMITDRRACLERFDARVEDGMVCVRVPPSA